MASDNALVTAQEQHRQAIDNPEEARELVNAEKSARTARRVRGNPDKIKPFQYPKGVSGNPGGRPKNDLAREIAKAIFENNKEGAYNALAKALMRGNAHVFKELADRAYGKVTEKHELTGKDGAPLEYCDMTEAQLSERIKQLECDLGLVRQIDDAGRAGRSCGARSSKDERRV